MPRTDKKKNVWKVAKVLVKNPHATEREIAKEVWLWKSTVNRAKVELGQTGTKDETISYIVWASKNRLKKIQQVMDRFVDESIAKDELSRSDTSLIKDIAKDDLQRITVLWGDVTDENGWLKVVSESDFIE